MRNKIFGVILIIVLLILASTLVYLIAIQETEEEEPKPVPKEIDDQISPITNQGITIEILRIRHRGIFEQVFKKTYNVGDPPRSYWIISMDGKECDSLGNVGYGSEGLYTEWDTMLQECRSNYWVENGTEKSSVVIKIMQENKVGFLKRKIQKMMIEEFTVLYDYRTGRWMGDDYFKDKDGYGHYLGKKVEVWFNIYQADYDHDGIPYWTEINVLGTDPRIDDSKLDPDLDGIPTSWEWKWYYDPFVWDDHYNLDPDLDGLGNIEEYFMSEWYANPYQPDIYIETDGMQKKNIFDLKHEFHEDSQQMIIERFAQHGINVYIDDGWPDGPVNGGGELLPFIRKIDEVAGGQVLGFYQHNFPDERKGIFRYVLIANLLGWNTPCEYNTYDTILVFSSRRSNFGSFVAVTPRLRTLLLAKGVLHELGHSMGLLPYTFPGNDICEPIGARYPNMDPGEYEKYMIQYHSIMNYYYIYGDRKLFDYSDGINGPPYDQNDWEHLYLPSFQCDARAYEEPVDETFEDFEVFIDEIYPEIDGWRYDENLSEQYNVRFKSIVYSDLNIDNDLRIYVADMDYDSRNVKIYARPNIDPFPMIQSWTLVAEGNLVDNEIMLYSYEEILNELLDMII